MTRPTCACFEQVGGEGDKYTDTLASDIMQWASVSLQQFPICGAGEPYVLATLAAAVLMSGDILRQGRAALAAGQEGGQLDVDPASVIRAALSLLPLVEEQVRARMALLERSGRCN